MTTLDAALALEPDHLSLYALTLDDPDAEGLTGPDRRPPADDHRARAAGATPSTRPGRGPRRRPVPPRRPPAGRRRVSRLRDLQLGAARAREPAQPRLLAAPAVRGGRAGRPRLRRRRRGAGTRPAWTATWRPFGGATPTCCRRAAVEASTSRPRRPEAVILGLRLDTGVPLASGHEPPLADASAGRSPPSCSTSPRTTGSC